MRAGNEGKSTNVRQAREQGEDQVRPPTSKGSASLVGAIHGQQAGPIGSRPVFYLAMAMIVGILVALPVRAAGPAPVDLGTAGNFVILSKAGISTTGTTSITGDIGVSPITASAITGFGLTLDASNEFSTSPLVAGKVFAADYAPPTPAKMTTAVSDMETAFTDAAGRALPDHTDLFAGDITGQTLAPGLYKWSTGLLISAGGVTISGNATDVWIFQIAQDLTVDSAAIVGLIGGASATNIFWQVSGQTTVGTTAQMKGIILCQTQIVMSTSASLLGRALAQTAVTLDANVVTVSDLLFSDGFETGNTVRWSLTVP